MALSPHHRCDQALAGPADHVFDAVEDLHSPPRSPGPPGPAPRLP
jgi:hypothetical protein